ARRWNDANVLVMSLRLTAPSVATEMLDAWFGTEPDPEEAARIAALDGGASSRQAGGEGSSSRH
ncbi:MAG: RpiB/LacA/LacB family sugar-phosphate isomerase, partial [Actinomycetota bacterium]|nr:RpiB/LacA/LacB family sugar-phosphate isomerase [Actinomycetota bacterium]